MTKPSDRSYPKLTLKQRLVPPMKSIGQGTNALRYTSQSPAWSADFSRDGQWLAVCYGSPDPCVRMWKCADDSRQWTLHSTLDGVHPRTIRCVAFCPLAKSYIFAAASFDASVSIWEFSSTGEWECTTQLEGHDHEVKAVAWNATGSLLATCGRDKT
jgi:cytosolic iron-sulfur protein assembly protein CIAO1